MSSSDRTILGIDISKEKIDAELLSTGERWTVPNSWDPLESWTAQLPEGITLAVMEATGGLEFPLAAILETAGIPVRIVNPAWIRAFSHSRGPQAKTDRVDARLIARYAHAMDLEPQPVSSERQQQLKELSARRRQLMEMVCAEKHRLGSTRSASLRTGIETHIVWITTQITDIDAQIKNLLHASEEDREKEAQLRSIPGIGETTARLILVELPELGSLSHKQIAKLAGLAPIDRASGKYVGLSRIMGGRGAVRSILFMATLTATRYNPAIRAFYQRLRSAGKPAKVALTACMRKLLVFANAILQSEQNWNPALCKS